MDDTAAIAPPRGLAADASGRLQDMPRDLAHSVNSELLDVVTLLHAIRDAVDDKTDDDGLTDGPSRAVALAHIADDKVRAMLRSIAPYV